MLYIVRIQRSVIWNGNVFLQRNCHLPLRYYCIASLFLIPVELYSRNHAHSDDVAFFCQHICFSTNFQSSFALNRWFSHFAAMSHISMFRFLRVFVRSDDLHTVRSAFRAFYVRFSRTYAGTPIHCHRASQVAEALHVVSRLRRVMRRDIYLRHVSV